MNAKIKLFTALALISAALPMSAAQQEGNTPPTITNVRFFILRNFFNFSSPGQFRPVLNDFVPDPSLQFNPAEDLAEEGDLLIVIVTVFDPDFMTEAPDPENPMTGMDGDEIFFRQDSFWLPFQNYSSPEPPPIPDDTPIFLPTGDEGLRPPPGQLELDVLFTISVPRFNGQNQAKLRGLIDFDVRWFVTLYVSNEQDPAPENFATTVDSFSFIFRAVKDPALIGANPPAFADAGPDQIVAAGTTVVLDGSGTFDSYNLGFNPDDPNVFERDQLDFTWEWLAGPTRVDPVYPDPQGRPAIVEVSLTQIGTYVYRLIVDDNINALPTSDTVEIEVVSQLPQNRPPIAVISGPSAPVVLGAIIQLDGTGSSDPDGDRLSFRWRQTDEIGGLLDSTTFQSVFQPLGGLTEPVSSWQAIRTGTFHFRLLVSDGIEMRTTRTSVTVVPPGAADSSTSAPLAPPASSTGDGAASESDANRSPLAAPVSACGGGLAMVMLVPLGLWLIRRVR